MWKDTYTILALVYGLLSESSTSANALKKGVLYGAWNTKAARWRNDFNRDASPATPNPYTSLNPT